MLFRKSHSLWSRGHYCCLWACQNQTNGFLYQIYSCKGLDSEPHSLWCCICVSCLMECWYRVMWKSIDIFLYHLWSHQKFCWKVHEILCDHMKYVLIILWKTVERMESNSCFIPQAMLKKYSFWFWGCSSGLWLAQRRGRENVEYKFFI